MINFKDILVRSASGIVLVVVLLAAVILNDYTKFTIFTIIGVLSLWEMLTTLKPSDINVQKCSALFSALIIIASFGFCQFDIISIETALIIVVASIMFRFIVEMFRSKPMPAVSIAYELFSIVYTVMPMMLITTLPSNLVVALMVIIWVNDIGAYLIGVSIGKHKFWERLSPKKSWEGFLGGMIITLGISILISYFCEINGNSSAVMWMLITIPVAISGVFGDLFESMLKRSVSVKDSGKIIPGHGGFLDRFDALLFAAPVMWIIYNLLA